MLTVPEEAAALKWPFADANSLIAAIKAGRKVREAIARQWIAEGVPFAFVNCPMFYECIRAWLGSELGVSAKSIAVTGSGSLGQSLVPGKFGRAFDDQSDLDLFIVSKSLFQRLVDDFNKWSNDYENNRINPKGAEQRFWPNNFKEGPRNISRGFLDAKRIPNRQQYCTAPKTNNLMWVLKEKCKRNPAVPDFSKASVRCYKDWKSAIDQLSLNLKFQAEPE